jgi:hypothetical protein
MSGRPARAVPGGTGVELSLSSQSTARARARVGSKRGHQVGQMGPGGDENVPIERLVARCLAE